MFAFLTSSLTVISIFFITLPLLIISKVPILSPTFYFVGLEDSIKFKSNNNAIISDAQDFFTPNISAMSSHLKSY